MQRLLSKPLRFSTPLRIGIKALIHLIVLGYLVGLLYLGINDALGADPVKSLIHNSGLAAVILLLTSLSISPLAKYLPSGDLIKFRRLIGVYAFVAALFHLSIYIVFDIQLNFTLFLNEIIKRPYITVGMATLTLLLLLTATSFNRIRRKMGRNWQRLHNWVYVAILLGLVHFSWSEKTLLQSSIYYWAIALLLLSFRLPKFTAKW